MKIIAYAEDFPAAEHVVSHGLSRVNGRLLDCLRPELDALLANRCGYWWQDADLATGLKKVRQPPAWLRRMNRFLSDHAPGFFPESELIIAWARMRGGLQKGDWLFCPCGSQPEPAIRAGLLARKLNLKLALYLVDHFEAAHRLRYGSEIPEALLHQTHEVLGQADAVFTITRELAEHIQPHCRIEPTVLPLPYPQTNPALSNQLRKQILFVGNASHFYLDGLCDLVEALESLPTKDKATLRITLGKRDQLPPALRDSSLVETGPNGGSEELGGEIAGSVFCYLPYSFDPKFREMVTTSFPSKLLDYLAHAKSILCYAPEDSTSARYFAHHGLETALTIRDGNKLKAVISRLIQKTSDCSDSYRKALLSHDPRTIRNTILETVASASRR